MDFLHFVYENNPTHLALIGLAIVGAIFIIRNLHRWKSVDQIKLGWGLLVFLIFLSFYLIVAEWHNYKVPLETHEVSQPPVEIAPVPQTKTMKISSTFPASQKVELIPLNVTLAGQIIDATSMEPLTGAQITVNDFQVAPPNDNGWFTMEVPNLLASEGMLIVRHPGYEVYRKNLSLEKHKSKLHIQMQPVHHLK